MASQVLSGSSNPTYTNNTGENVRIIINYAENITDISWAGVSAATAPSGFTIGRNLAFHKEEDAGSASLTASNGFYSTASDAALPTELMLASGQAFSALCGVYNIVVIPEGG